MISYGGGSYWFGGISNLDLTVYYLGFWRVHMVQIPSEVVIPIAIHLSNISNGFLGKCLTACAVKYLMLFVENQHSILYLDHGL